MSRELFPLIGKFIGDPNRESPLFFFNGDVIDFFYFFYFGNKEKQHVNFDFLFVGSLNSIYTYKYISFRKIVFYNTKLRKQKLVSSMMI